jgi:NitT/TauT family transport system ATP-binding protein
VFVTHNVDEAVYMAGRVLVFSAGPGRIIAEVKTPGSAPRPQGYRLQAEFRETVERVSTILEGAA